MKFLVLQHIGVEHPGIFRDYMQTDGIVWDAIELDQGESIPSLDGYDALIVMGGPMDVWEELKYHWLIEEKETIATAIVERKLPYLGFCLGHQLMADALGGEVLAMSAAEVGILDVELNEVGRRASLFAGLPDKIKSLQWHGAEVAVAPPNSQVLAVSPACAIQALQYGDTAFSVQFHIELTDTTVADWGKVPAYEQSLEKMLGAGALQHLARRAQDNMGEFNRCANLMYNNFINMIKVKQS